jgi:hypothetical protein
LFLASSKIENWLDFILNPFEYTRNNIASDMYS